MSDGKSFRQRFARMAVIGASVVGAALFTQVAHASVVTDNFSGNALSIVPFSLDGVYVNVVTGAASTDYTAVPGWDINPFFLGTDGSRPLTFDLFSLEGGIVVGAIVPSIPAESLAIGQTIGPGTELGYQPANASADGAGIHYFGFTFLNDTTGAYDYGYIAIDQSTEYAAEGAERILGWAYDDDGGAITVSALSAVPEPATWAMFGAGVLAFLALGARRRRSSVARA